MSYTFRWYPEQRWSFPVLRPQVWTPEWCHLPFNKALGAQASPSTIISFREAVPACFWVLHSTFISPLYPLFIWSFPPNPGHFGELPLSFHKSSQKESFAISISSIALCSSCCSELMLSRSKIATTLARRIPSARDGSPAVWRFAESYEGSFRWSKMRTMDFESAEENQRTREGARREENELFCSWKKDRFVLRGSWCKPTLA